MKIHNFVLTFLAIGVIAMSTGSVADDDGVINNAWLDGKLDTVVLFNDHLNPFDIDTEVKNGVAILNGSVDSEIKKITFMSLR